MLVSWINLFLQPTGAPQYLRYSTPYLLVTWQPKEQSYSTPVLMDTYHQPQQLWLLYAME